MFVFRNGEPLSSWLTVICGPLSTLPAVIWSIPRPKTGAYWLIAGGIIALVEGAITMRHDGATDVFAFVKWVFAFPGAMALLGLGTLLVDRSSRSKERGRSGGVDFGVPYKRAHRIR